MDGEQGIYRGEVRAIMLGLSYIGFDVRRILDYCEGGDDEAEEEDLPDA